MTSQVVLGNGHGIGIASDSAVTIGTRRTYETAEKVIPLAEPHKIAVLVSGAVTQFSMPLAVLIKEWAKTLERIPLRKVSEYRASFTSWLQDNIDEYSDGARREVSAFWEIDQFIGDIWRGLSDQTFESIEARTEAVLEDLDLALQETQPWRLLAEISDSQARSIIGRLWQPVEDLRPGLGARVAFWFDDVDRYDQVEAAVKEYLISRLQKWTLLGDLSKVTFVGYGAREFVPTVAQVALMGGIGTWVARSIYEIQTAQALDNSYWLITTMGQTDAIDLMLRGYSRELVDSAVAKVGGVLSEIEPSQVSDSERPDLSAAIRGSMSDLAEERNLGPLRRAIGVLPLRSLAEAAQSLVGVQALTNLITAQLPTVGGEIEVATITLAEGFRWVSHSA